MELKSNSTAFVVRDYDQDLARFIQRIQEISPVYAQIVERQRQALGEPWLREFIDDMHLLFGSAENGNWEKSILGYVEFSIDASRSQHFFEKYGRYQASSFADVQQSAYDNEAFMLSNYLPGMVLSHYLWPHHYRMGLTYRHQLLPRVRKNIDPRSFIEAGSGSGMFALHTLRALPLVRGTTYDISPHSVVFTKQLLGRAGVLDRCAVLQRDICANPPSDSADFILSQEVLEHLEDPATFCANLYRILRPGGMGFVTAAVTAGHSDHIYLFETPRKVFVMLEECGFRLVETLVEEADNPREKKIVPKIAGALVEKS